MSKRIVDDPSLHGWTEENGKWVWGGGADNEHPIVDGDTEGQVTTWDGDKWTPDSGLVIDASGNAAFSGTVNTGDNVYVGANAVGRIQESGAELRVGSTGSLVFRSGGYSQVANTRLTIDAAGNVGIGMEPVTRTAKEQLSEWKTKASENSWTDVTDGEFSQEPTEELVQQWMETRAAGDKLQVAGPVWFARSAGGEQGIRFSSDSSGSRIVAHGDNKPFEIHNYDDVYGRVNFFHGSAKQLSLSLKPNGDAEFSGTVSAQKLDSAWWLRTGDDVGLLLGDFSGEKAFAGTNGNGTLAKNTVSIGTSTEKFKDGWFSGTVTANKFVGDGSGLTGVGGGLPPGDFTHNGKITATDFIATSDERVKDNISTAPVGLIDSLKGREWDWKESGEKGSGVVAQELEQVLPHLVHTDDEGMKSVAYNGLVAYLIEEVKLLRAEVEALK